MSLSVHMTLQGKGGVGKSYVAFLLAQHFRGRGIEPVCVDSDPVNQTFAGYGALGVRRLELMQGDDFNPRAFDRLIEWVLSEPFPVFVVDNGATSFIPLCSWMIENEVAAFLAAEGISLWLHSVVVGGPAQADTMVGVKSVVEHFPDVPVVVWLNEFFGKAERDGVAFEQSKLMREHGARIRAAIRIPALRRETFGADIDDMLAARLTFEEALEDEGFAVMARQRLRMVWRDLDRAMAAAGLAGSSAAADEAAE